MFSSYKILFGFLAMMQFMTGSIAAEINPDYVFLMGDQEELNNELILIQEQAYNENKFFELVYVEVNKSRIPHASFKISDKMGQINAMIYQVVLISNWERDDTKKELADKINHLQALAASQNKDINFKHVEIIPTYILALPAGTNGYIIYEISK